MQNSQTYHIKSVRDTTLDPDKYGNQFYSIEVEGIQGNLLWKTKNRPVAGVSVYGHTEPSQSGKAVLFKRDQKPEDYQEPQQPSYTDNLSKGVDMSQPTNAQLMKQLQAIEETLQLVVEHLDVKVKDKVLTSEEEDAVGDEPIDLDSIPFK